MAVSSEVIERYMACQQFLIHGLLCIEIAFPFWFVYLGFFPHLAVALFASVPVAFRFQLDGTIYGLTEFSKAQGAVVFRSFDSCLHFFQGLMAAFTFICFIEMPSQLRVSQVILATVAWVYPMYNLIKRYRKHRDHFWDSSFYLNHADFIVGLWIGNFIFWLTAWKVPLLPLMDTEVFPRFQPFYACFLLWNVTVGVLGLISRKEESDYTELCKKESPSCSELEDEKTQTSPNLSFSDLNATLD